MKQAFENYKLPQPKKAAHYEWQQRALDVIEEMRIPKEVVIKDKKIGLHAVIFKHFKRSRSQAEAFYQYAKLKKTPGRYFCWLILNRKKI